MSNDSFVTVVSVTNCFMIDDHMIFTAMDQKTGTNLISYFPLGRNLYHAKRGKNDFHNCVINYSQTTKDSYKKRNMGNKHIEEILMAVPKIKKNK